MAKYNEPSAVKANGSPLQRLKDSVGKYELPFEPVGVDDWEAIQLEELASVTHLGDENEPR